MATREKGAGMTSYLVIGAIVIFGFLGIKNFLATKDSSTQETSTTSSSSLDYPALYKTNGLPEYDDATLTDIGRQQTSIKDGLRLTLTSELPVQEIANYYEDAMKSLGWTIPEQKSKIDSLYLGSYTKGDLYYQITIMKLPDKEETKISIVFAQNE